MFKTFVTFIAAWLRAYNCALLFGLFYGFLCTLPLSPPQIYFTRSFLLEHDERRRSEFKKKYLGQEKGFRLRESQVILSGSLFAQAIVFLSIYCAPIYGAFFKPHVMLFLVIPTVYVILHKYVEELSTNRRNLLLIGIVLQIMNPILFFSDSTFTRLINLLLFRYTENLVFLISLFVGWLSGQILFIKLAKLFCLRIERDSALLGSKYTTSKRYIRESFKILFFGYFLLFCFSGNTPNPLFTKRFNEELLGKSAIVDVESFSTIKESVQELREKEQGKKTRVRLSTKSGDKRTSKKKKSPVVVPIDSDEAMDDKIYEIEDEEAADENKDGDRKPYLITDIISPWIGKTWPNLFYDYRRWNWPLRYIDVNTKNIVQWHFVGLPKTEVSDYFFDTCISDGRERLSFTSSPGFSLPAKMIRQKMPLFLRHSESVSGSEMDSSNEEQMEKWIAAKTRRRDYLGRELEDRVKALSKGSPILDVIDKRVKFSTESGTCLPEIEDPFLSGPFRGIMEHSESGWIPLSNKISKEDRLVQELSARLQEQRRTPEEEKPTKLKQQRTPEEEKHAKLTVDEIKSLLELIKKKKRLEEIRPKLIKAKEVQIIVKTAMGKLKKLIQFSNELCLFFDEKKLSFLEEHGKNERISNTPDYKQISDQREGENIIQIMDELIGEFSLFINKKEKKNSDIIDIDVIGNFKEGSLSGEAVVGKLIDQFFFFVDKKLFFLEESQKNEQISTQKKEDDNFEKEISAHILFFPENKKVKSIFRFWLPLFDLFRRKKVGFEKLEKLVSSERKAEKPLELNTYTLFKKIFLNELKLSEIKRDVPFWASKLLANADHDDYGKGNDLDVSRPEVRSALVLDQPEKKEDTPIISRFWEADDDRSLVKGSIRAQRRNLNTWMLMDPYVRSSFFVRYSEMSAKSEEIRRKSKRRGKFYVKANWEKHSPRRLRKMYKPFLTRAEDDRLEELTWMDEDFGQIIRSFGLIILLYIRKYIIVPSFIITKNIVRTLLFQIPEWKEDWEDWGKEMYIICDYDGVEYSETQYPEDFWEIGIQIKILSPFRFKPWHEEHHSEGDAGYLTMNPIVLTEKPFSDAVRASQNQKREDMSQVLWEEFLGPMRRFWEPRIKEMIARIKQFIRPAIKHVKELTRHIKESIRRVIGRIKEWIKEFVKLDIWIKHIQELIGQVIERIRKLIRDSKESIERVIERIKKLIERVMKRIKSIQKYELQPDNKSIDDVEMNDQVPSQLRIPSRSQLRIPSRSQLRPKAKPRVEDKIAIDTRPKIKERNDEIKQITEKYLLNLEINTKLKKKIDQYYKAARLKNKQVQNRIRAITSRKKSARFRIKPNSRYFKKLVLRKQLLVIKFKLSVLNLIDSIFDLLNVTRRKIAAITNYFSKKIWITKKKKDFHFGPNKISQAYVFHKMWQIRVMNKSYAKDLLKSRTSSPFIKKNIKEFLDIQGILESKQPQDLRINKWKQWLNSCYGYRVVKTKGSRFSQIWSRVAPQKRGKNFSNQWSKSEFESFIGMLQKWNKRYRFDLLAYNYLTSKKEPIHGPIVQDMVLRNIPDDPNTNKKTRKRLVSNFFTLDKSDLKLRRAKWYKKESDKSEEKSDKQSDTSEEKSDKQSDTSEEKSDKQSDTKEKNKASGNKNLYYIDAFANEIKTDQSKEIETHQFKEMEMEIDQSFDRSKSNLKSDESETDESSLIEFLDGYKFLKSYWFFPIFAENLELSETIQTIRSDLTPLIEYCRIHLPVEQYLSELNSYYYELCKERGKKVKDYDKINEIRIHLNKINVSLDKLSPHIENFITKAYAKSNLKLAWLKPDVSFKLVVEKKKISRKLLEEEMKPLAPEENEATLETQIQLIREEMDKLREEMDKVRREEAERVLKQKTKAEEETKAEEKTKAEEETTAKEEKAAEENRIQTECKVYYEVALRDYLRKGDRTLFVPLNKVVEKARLTSEIVAYKRKLAEAIDAFHFICSKREGMSEFDFWKSAFWKNLSQIMNQVAELDKFPTIQLNKVKTFNIVLTDLKKAIEKQPKKQGNEEERDYNDKNAYDEVEYQLKPGWKKGDETNVWVQNHRVGARLHARNISRNGGVYLLKEELWFLSRYEYIVNTLDYLLYSESKKSDKSKSKKSESDKSKLDEAKSNLDKIAKDKKIHEKKRKVHGEVPLSTRAIRQVQKICNRNDATDVVVFLHKFYSEKSPEILELEKRLVKEKKITQYVRNWLSFNDCPNHWALLGGCYDDRSLIDQMLFNMWLDPLVCLSAVSKDIQVFKLNNKFREGLYVNLSDRSVRCILNEKIASSLIFEDILLPRRRREFRILNRLNLENNLGKESTGYSDGKEYVQNDEEFMEKDQYLAIDTTQEMKRFLWPRYRVEDLICMNRYWWNSHNRSRSVLKVRMYPKMDNWNSWDNFLFLITEYMKKLLFLMHSLIKKLLFYTNKAEHSSALQRDRQK
uniref:Protein TIC 214 n=1 Tax=Lepidothamnus intermedius TaxID=224738 RepID=A0A3T0ZDM9_9CONI|nr:hypothetical protein [Lepidothamnus intermedius]